MLQLKPFPQAKQVVAQLDWVTGGDAAFWKAPESLGGKAYHRRRTTDLGIEESTSLPWSNGVEW